MVFSSTCGGAGGLRLVRARKKARKLGCWKSQRRLFAIYYQNFGGRTRKGQGNHGDVPWGVQVAGLEGHMSRSAVYLIHKGVDRRRAEEGYIRGRPMLRNRMLSHAE